MSGIRYLVDEDTDPDLLNAVRAREPLIELLRVGDDGAPLRGTLDPGLIQFAEAGRWLLVTRDRGTMSKHLAEHWAAGGHTWGTCLVRPTASWQELIDDLILFWSASQAEEWQDRVEYIPW